MSFKKLGSTKGGDDYFIVHQYKRWNDTFIEIVLRSAQQHMNKIAIVMGEINTEKLPASLFLWAQTNLLFVCVAEEVFFIGLFKNIFV